MQNALRSIAKTTVIFATAGLLLGFALPHLAVAFGFAATANAAIATLHLASPAFYTMFLGAFGCFNATVGTALNWMSGNNTPYSPVKLSDVKTAPQVAAPSLVPPQELQQESENSHFRTYVQTRKQDAQRIFPS